jgi:hypothetical protein
MNGRAPSEWKGWYGERMRNAAVAGAEDFGGVKWQPRPVDKVGAIS